MISNNIGFKGEHGKSRQRLALARQAGYLGSNPRIPGGDAEATSEWRRASKHLAETAREKGHSDARQYLYDEVQQGSRGLQAKPGVKPSTAPKTIADRWNAIILAYGPHMRAR